MPLNPSSAAGGPVGIVSTLYGLVSGFTGGPGTATLARGPNALPVTPISPGLRRNTIWDVTYPEVTPPGTPPEPNPMEPTPPGQPGPPTTPAFPGPPVLIAPGPPVYIEPGYPSQGFVGPMVLPQVATTTAATGVAAALLRVLPWLGMIWPDSTSPDDVVFRPGEVPQPTGPPRGRNPVTLDPTDPYPSRRTRTPRTRVLGTAVPEFEEQPLPRVRSVPRPYVPPQPVIFDPVFDPLEFPVPRYEPAPSTPSDPRVQPGPGTAPAPGAPTGPAPRPRTPAVPALPDLLPFLPLYLPGTGPRTATPALPGFDPIPRGQPTPSTPIQPLTPPFEDPLGFAQPQPQPQPRTAEQQCQDLMKRRKKSRKCVERDNCNRCVRYAPL